LPTRPVAVGRVACEPTAASSPEAISRRQG
jgi:hypothetical protein